VRHLAPALAVALLCAGLAGCTSQQKRYCSAVEHQQGPLAKLAAGSGERGGDPGGDPGGDVVGDSLAIFTDLAAQAPDDVAGDWDTVVFAWQQLDDALTAAGISADDVRPGQRPAGVSAAEYRALTGAAEQLRSPRVLAAAGSIQQHARDVCKVDLGL
jgi:hypothetical protein